MPKYKLLKCEEFGKILLKTNDLDPIYVMLWDAKLDDQTLNRWLLGYWWFYHGGVASRLAQERSANDFYRTALQMASRLVPRGSERRHFRGKAAANCIKWFWDTYYYAEGPVNDMVMKALMNPNLGDFMKAAQYELHWPLFGPWMMFKVADMLERIKRVPIVFNRADLIYDAPQQGGKLLAHARKWDFDKIGLPGVLRKMEVIFKGYKAPPRYERPIGVQEFETILCKWKSHLSGHYPIGKDIHEIQEGLKGWGPLADRLSSHLPKGESK